MTKFMKRKNVGFLAVTIAASTVAAPLWAGDGDAPPRASASRDSSIKGFFYDSKTNRYFSDGHSSFSLRPVEDTRYLEKIEVSVDEAEFAAYKDKLQFPTEGLHQIRFRAQDTVLNWSPLQDFQVYVDITPPVSQPVWQGPNFKTETTTYINSNSKLTIATQDNLSGVSKVFWEERGSISATPSQMQFKGDGEHNARFAAVDHVGNQEPWHEMKFVVDSKAPVTKAEVKGTSAQVGNIQFVGSGSQIALTAADDSSGVQTTEFQINGGPITVYQGPIPVLDPKTELKFRSVDHVANQEAWKTITVVLDTTPPALTVEKQGTSVAIGGRIYATPGFALIAVAKDAESGIANFEFSYDGKTFQKGNTNKLNFSQPGEYHFLARASDRVGNTAEANPLIVIIDNQPPKTLLKPNDRLVQKDGVWLSPIPNKIEFSSEDAGVGVDHIEISYDGKTFTPMPGAIDLAQWNTPKKTIFYRAVDRLGNREATQSMPVQIKSEGPKVDLMVESTNLPEVPLSALKKSDRYPSSTGSKQ
jgi:hypothetical protein